jgi:hypothetical protein
MVSLAFLGGNGGGWYVEAKRLQSRRQQMRQGKENEMQLAQ